MGKIIDLREAINLIAETVEISKEHNNKKLPYVFIVGAGISCPEILSAKEIIEHCKNKVKEFYKDDEEELKKINIQAGMYSENCAKHYSFWFEQAYKNKIHRQEFLKEIINKARISTSNFLLAQILNTKEIATTVITPNFDNQILKSLNLLGNYNVFSADNESDNIALDKYSFDIQIMHVHGTYQFYDCCNLENEIVCRANIEGLKSTSRTLEDFMKNQAPIVIGYSGWEDDVIMKTLKERLEYPLPIKLIWFCYSKKDYESLPTWLKKSEDVTFVLQFKVNEVIENDINKTMESDINKEEVCLPAEDVFTAIITKFGFQAPNLLRNPIQYYIELIDDFLPENENIFPTKSWKRRLDYIEEYFSDIDKKIIKLEEASARKNINDAKEILKTLDVNYISKEDLSHIFDGIVMPLINNKNRIENENDLYEFLDEIIDLLGKGKDLFKIDRLDNYLKRIIGFTSRHNECVEDKKMENLYNNIINLTKGRDELEEVELVALGMKSEIVDPNEKEEIQNYIIKRGKSKKENVHIARLVMVAIGKQVNKNMVISQEQRKILTEITNLHNDNTHFMEDYYNRMVEFYRKGIDIGMKLTDVIDIVSKKHLSSSIVLYCRRVLCDKEKNAQEKVEIAKLALTEFEFEKIDECRDCLNYAVLVASIILGESELGHIIEQKYVDYIFRLCNKEEGCPYVGKLMMDVLEIYVEYIQSVFEKKELCKKAIILCYKSQLYKHWVYFNDLYLDLCEEKEEYLSNNVEYNSYIEASSKMSQAIDFYINMNKEMCESHLIEASNMFDEIFKGKYNPALINICFMLRRNEIENFECTVWELLNKIKWMNGNAIFHINKALVYLEMEKWELANDEISKIEFNVEDAVEWWKEESVVGEKEKYLVFLLLEENENIQNLSIDDNIRDILKSYANKTDLPREINDIKFKLRNFSEIK